MPPKSPYPEGVAVLPASPGGVNTPTTQVQSRYSATPNVLPLIVDLVIGVKNLVFRDALAVLSTGTGGEHYKPLTEEGIENSLVKIGEDIRSQYVLTYRPQNREASGLWHSIRVEVPYQNARVRYRPGYLWGPRPGTGGGEPAQSGQP